MRKKLMVVFIGFAGLALAIAGLQFIQHKSQGDAIRKVTDQFVQDVVKGDASGSYKLFSSKGQKGVDSTTWQGTVATLSSFFGSRQPVFKSEVKTGPGYTVTYTIPGNDGTYAFTLLVSAQQDSWYIDYFNSKLEQ